jgi:hypothetical protein
MTPLRDIASELEYRIQADIEHFSGILPERNAIAWRAYLAALLEWNMIGPAEFDKLRGLVPPVEDDPALAILRGRE